MHTTLRILQIGVGLLSPLIALLGLMAALSGGGMNPAFQQIGGWLMYVPLPSAAVGIILSQLLWRWKQPWLALIVIILPLVVWAGLLVWLEQRTNFFLTR
ncbi:MAG: hypothetical protein AAF708_19395 [Deinococcota bacterium]